MLGPHQSLHYGFTLLSLLRLHLPKYSAGMSTLHEQSTDRPAERLSIVVHPSGPSGHAPRVLVPCEGTGHTDALLANTPFNRTTPSTQGDEGSKAVNAFVASPISFNGDHRRYSKAINNNGTPTEAVNPTDAANRMSVATATVIYPPPPSLPLRIQAPVPVTLVLSFWQHLLWVLAPLCLAGALGALVVFLTNHFHASSAVHLVVISAYFFLSFLFLGVMGMEMRTFAQRKWERMVKREEVGRSAGEVWTTEQIPLDEWQEWRLRRRSTERSAGNIRKVKSSQASNRREEGACKEPLARQQVQDMELAGRPTDYDEADQTDLSYKEDISSVSLCGHWFYATTKYIPNHASLYQQARASYHSRHSVDAPSLSASTRANASIGPADVDMSSHGTNRHAHSVTDAATIAPSSRLGTQSSQRAPTSASGRTGSVGPSSASIIAQSAASVSASSSAATKGRSATDETAVEGRPADSSRRNSFKNEARQAAATGVPASVPVPALAKEATLRAIPTSRPAAPWKMPVNMPVSAPGSTNGNAKQAQQAQVVTADHGQVRQGASHQTVYHQQQQHHQTQRKPAEQRYHHPHHPHPFRIVSTSEGDAFADAEESADASLMARGRAVGAGGSRAHGRR